MLKTIVGFNELRFRKKKTYPQARFNEIVKAKLSGKGPLLMNLNEIQNYWKWNYFSAVRQQ